MNNPKIGEIFQERYLIRSQLGAGGMGSVFRATQIDADREVALKLLRQESIGDQETIQRFYREFKILSQLEHPNIVTIYGLAIDDSSLPFAICELIEGKSLRACLQDGAMDWHRAVKITLQICNAMHFAHEHGVIHRDLKPDNVMLLDIPEPDFVKLIDFGLSRASIIELDESQRLTFTGQLLGTANYMSPDMSAANRQSDVYSLGCILFEMLSGEYLFDADNGVGILYLHANGLVKERFSSIRAKIPKPLYSIMEKALAKSPDSRYENMELFEDDLKDVINNPGKLYSGLEQKTSKKYPLTKSTSVLIGGLLLLFVAGVLLGPKIFRSEEYKGKSSAYSKEGSRYLVVDHVDSTQDLMNSEKWIVNEVQNATVPDIDLATIGAACLKYRIMMDYKIKRPPYVSALLERFRVDAKTKIIRTATQLGTALRIAELYATLGDDKTACQIIRAVRPNAKLDGNTFISTLKRIIVNCQLTKTDPSPYFAMVKDFVSGNDNQVLIAKCYLALSDECASKNDMAGFRRYTLKACEELIRADERGVPLEFEDVAVCGQQLAKCKEYRQMIKLGELINFETLEHYHTWAAQQIELFLATAYLETNESAKALRIARIMRDSIFEFSPASPLSDDAEEIIIRTMRTKNTSSQTTREEARQYLHKVFEKSAERYVESLRKINHLLESLPPNKSRSRIMKDDVEANAKVLALTKPAVYRKLLNYRIELLSDDKKNAKSQALAMSLAEDLFAAYKSLQNWTPEDLVLIQNLSTFFQEQNYNSKSSECDLLRVAAQERFKSKLEN